MQVSSVTREADTKGVEYVYATVRHAGRQAADVSVRGMQQSWSGSLPQPHMSLFLWLEPAQPALPSLPFN